GVRDPGRSDRWNRPTSAILPDQRPSRMRQVRRSPLPLTCRTPSPGTQEGADRIRSRREQPGVLSIVSKGSGPSGSSPDLVVPRPWSDHGLVHWRRLSRRLLVLVLIALALLAYGLSGSLESHPHFR